ncbi:hypothetical protein P3S67_015160 [Capsicum chacoense]
MRNKWRGEREIREAKAERKQFFLRQNFAENTISDRTQQKIVKPVVTLTKILLFFTSIDFSSNNFVGNIPETVGDLKSLYLLNISHNNLKGQIPPTFGDLKQLGSLDLLFNKLGGNIPEKLASLTSLSFLNLSYNEFVGMIPRGIQHQHLKKVLSQETRGYVDFR